MEAFFAVSAGVLCGAAAYLIMSRSVLRILLGLLLLGNGANLTLFVAGRLDSSLPPLVPAGASVLEGGANPLPQALILTAIVIAFALVAFAVVLYERASARLGTTDPDAMRAAEPADGPTAATAVTGPTAAPAATAATGATR